MAEPRKMDVNSQLVSLGVMKRESSARSSKQQPRESGSSDLRAEMTSEEYMRLLKEDRTAYRRSIKLLSFNIPTRYQLDKRPLELDVDAILCKRGAFIYGSTGSGKSVQAANLLLHAIDNIPRLNCLWVDVFSYVEESKASASKSAKTTSVIKRKAVSKNGMVVLDDFGRDMGDSWSYEICQRLLWNLYNENVITIITSNRKIGNEVTNGSSVIKSFDSIDNALASRLGTFEYYDLGEKDRRDHGSTT